MNALIFILVNNPVAYRYTSDVQFLCTCLKGSEIVPTPDQDETDFTKCLREVLKRMSGQVLAKYMVNFVHWIVNRTLVC